MNKNYIIYIILAIFLLILLIIAGIYIYRYFNPAPIPPPTPPSNPSIGDNCTSQNCITNGECLSPPSAYCAASGVCLCGAGNALNANCNSNNACNYGLYCSGLHTCLAPSGNIPVQVTGNCHLTSDCYVGNMCDYNKTCQAGVNLTVNLSSQIMLDQVADQPYIIYDLNVAPTIVGSTALFGTSRAVFVTNGQNLLIRDVDNPLPVVVTTGGLLTANEGGVTVLSDVFVTYQASAAAGGGSGSGKVFISDRYNNNLRYNPIPAQPGDYLTYQVGFYDPINYQSPQTMSNWPYALILLD